MGSGRNKPPEPTQPESLEDSGCKQCLLGNRVPYESAAAALTFRGKSAVKRLNAPAWQCGCKPYTDILTRGRWNALGLYIRRGETALYRAGRSANIPVFCRCQVGTDSTNNAPVDFDPAEVPF